MASLLPYRINSSISVLLKNLRPIRWKTSYHDYNFNGELNGALLLVGLYFTGYSLYWGSAKHGIWYSHPWYPERYQEEIGSLTIILIIHKMKLLVNVPLI